MKKYFLMLAAATLCLAGCHKTPDTPDVPDTPDEGFKEKTFVVNITLQEGVNNTYDGVTGTMPGNEILDFLGLTAEEFYKGMGTYTGSAYPDPATTQEDNTILFGAADANNTETGLKWLPSSSNNFGHWFTKDGRICAWGDDAYFFVESEAEWGLDAPDANMWNWTVGCFPGRTAVGETYKATHVFFLTDDDDVERYAYVEWNISIVKAADVEVNIVKTQEINIDVEYYTDWTGTAIDVNVDDIQATLGVADTECTVYAVNADGTVNPAPGTDHWFSIAGDKMNYGEGCGIDINYNLGYWSICNYPNADVAGKTCKGAIVFVNSAKQGYLVKVTANVEGFDALKSRVLVSYETGETLYTLTEDQIAALAEELGLETVTADMIGTDIAVKGVNADGSIYDGEYTANNGYWYGLDGNVTNWDGIVAADYCGSYIEYRSDFTFGCGFWEESGAGNTVKLALVNGDKTAVLTFVLTVDEPKNFETEEAGTLEYTVTQTVAAGYGGTQVDVDAEAVATLIGGTADDWYLLDSTGSMNYTANGGFWFNASGEVCEWAEGAIYIEPAETFPSLSTGIQADNGTGAGTYSAKIRIANPDAGKHVTVTVTIVVTE